MEEEDEEEDLGWKEEFAPCRSRKLPCYTIGRENVSKKFCIPNVLTALILSGDMGMLEYGFDHYKLENPVVCRAKSKHWERRFFMEMKQKEQEINKRKKRLLWKEKRMKETVLNAMNPVEREIFDERTAESTPEKIHRP